MKDRIEIGHLTTHDAFRVNRDRAMNLEIWFKNRYKRLLRETAFPKIILKQPTTKIIKQTYNWHKRIELWIKTDFKRFGNFGRHFTRAACALVCCTRWRH